MSNPVARVSLSVGDLLTVEHEGEPWVVLKPAIEAIGLTWQPQHAKLRTRSWAVVTEIKTTGMDGKRYNMTCCSIDTFLMLLATINEAKVSEELKPTLVAYQRETRAAVGAYWTRGEVAQRGDTEAMNQALSAMDDVGRILSNALMEASQVLAKASRSIAGQDEGRSRVESGKAVPRREITREAASAAEERRRAIVQLYRDAEGEDPGLSMAEFIRRYNAAQEPDSWQLQAPYLSRALTEFPDL